MRLPLASIALAYSSTATPTMLDSRLAGPSWAPSDGVAPSVNSAAKTAAKTTCDFIPSEIIGDTNTALVGRNTGTGLKRPFEHDHGARRRRAMSKRHPDRRHS